MPAGVELALLGEPVEDLAADARHVVAVVEAADQQEAIFTDPVPQGRRRVR
jgi:hypothetical protein